MGLLTFFLTVNLILLSRLWLTFKDEGAGLKTVVKMSLVPLLSLLFIEFGAVWGFVLTVLVISPFIIYWTERKMTNIYLARGMVFLLQVVLLGVIFGFADNNGLNGVIERLLGSSQLFSSGGLLIVQVLLFGGLLVMNEMNILLRYLMIALNLAPIGDKKSESNITDQEYNTGRVIGMLERIFIYAFAISGQFAAIGFILTAKGIVRYHEFENRTFAEYVLIGTLLSALLAMGVALLVNLFIG